MRAFLSGLGSYTLTQWRAVWLVLTIFVLTGWVTFIPPMWVVGFLLGVWWVIKHRGEVRWMSLWPYGCLYVLYAISVLYAPFSVEASAWHWVWMRLPWLTIPFLFIGLKPTARMADAWVAGSVFSLLLALTIGLAHCHIESAPAGMHVYPYSIPAANSLYPPVLSWYGGLDQNSYITYSRLAGWVRNGATIMPFYELIALIIVVHRALRSSRRRWLRIAIALFMLVGIFLLENRSIQVALLGVIGVFLLHAIVQGKRRLFHPAWLLVPVVAGFAVILGNDRVMYYFQHPDVFFKEDARYLMWTRSLPHTEAYLPWGRGTAGSIAFAKPYLPDPHVAGFEFPLHNEYLDNLVEFGIIGLLFFIAMVVLPLVLWRRFAFVHHTLWIAMLLFMFFNNTSYTMAGIATFTIMWCLMWLYGSRREGPLPLFERSYV